MPLRQILFAVAGIARLAYLYSLPELKYGWMEEEIKIVNAQPYENGLNQPRGQTLP